MSNKCAECGQFIHANRSLCQSCASKRVSDHNPLVRQPPTSQKTSSSEWLEGRQFVDSVAVELKKDINTLMELGIKLEKGQLAAKTGGAAWAGYEAFTGDWLSALLVAGGSLLIGGLTNSYKRIKLMEMKQKWMNILSGLKREELNYLRAGLQSEYPMLMGSLQRLLQAGE